MDWPDTIKIKSVPVKIESSRTLIIRNVSKVPAVFKMCFKQPFNVIPLHGILNSNEMMTVTFKFKSQHLGNYQSYLKILYETGETLSILLEADTINENIALQTNILTFCDTFMSLKSHENLKLINNSDHVLSYQWKLYPNLEKDVCEFKRLQQQFKGIAKRDCTRYCDLEFHNIIQAEEHREVCERILEDEVDECDKKCKLFLYKSPNFEIMPKVSCQLFANLFLSVNLHIMHTKFFFLAVFFFGYNFR